MKNMKSGCIIHNGIGKIFSVLGLLICPFISVSAYDLEVDGIYYNIDLEGSTASVTTGEKQYEGHIIIPEQFEFRNKRFDVIDVNIQRMPNLRNISLPNSISSLLLSNCDNILRLDLPQSLRILVCNLRNLESLCLPDSIKEFTLKGCESLKRVDNIPENLDTIKPYQYYGCKKLKQIHLSNNIKVIGQHAFHGCNDLLGIVIPSNVLFIDDYAFNECYNLEFFNIEYSPNPLVVGCSNQSGFDLRHYYSDSPRSPKGLLSDCKLKKLFIDREIEERGVNYYSYSYKSDVIEKDLWGLDCKIDILEIGNHITEIPLNLDDISEVRVHSASPFELKALGTENYSFTKNTFLYGTLYVPLGAIDLFAESDMWKNFLSIQEIDYDTFKNKSVQIVHNEGGKVSLNGKSISSNQRIQLEECSIVNLKVDIDGDSYLESVSFNDDNSFSNSFYQSEYTFAIWNDIDAVIEFTKKRNYVEICNIKWTKGNLQYMATEEGYAEFKSHYRLAPHQWDIIEGSESYDYTDEFKHTICENATNDYCRLPSQKEAEALVNSSCQYGYYIVENDTVYGTLIVDSTRHYPTNIDLVKRFDERDMEIGLFLPCKYTDNEGVPIGKYWTSTEVFSSYVLYKKYVIMCGSFYIGSSYNKKKKVLSCDDAMDYVNTRLLIRPIWNNVINNPTTIIPSFYDNCTKTPIYYDLQGRRINHLKNGLYIVRDRDGQVKKKIHRSK